MGFCLVVEDDEVQRKMLTATLRTAGHTVVAVGSGREAMAAVGDHQPEVVLLDLGLPDADGLELIPKLLAAAPLARIVVITGEDSVRTAVGALRAGARHYLVKPWDLEELLVVIEREARSVRLAQASALDQQGSVFWGGSSEMERVRDSLAKVARSPLTPLLITGDTGTGKEVMARAVHRLTAPPGPFIPVNCAAVPGELLESELFGHERGAFTGAQGRRRGLVELADEGTLFFDEIGDMELPLQAKVLRFLEDRRFYRIGGEEQIAVRCRVVAATNRDLEEKMKAGMFRADLYYRLAVVTLQLPALRQRREDIVPMAYHFLSEIANQIGREPRQLSPAAEAALVAHPWPGNVRELRNRLERALILGSETVIQPADLDLAVDTPHPPAETVDGPERVRRVLEEEGWVVARAARRLGVPRHWLRYRMAKWNLTRPPSPGRHPSTG